MGLFIATVKDSATTCHSYTVANNDCYATRCMSCRSDCGPAFMYKKPHIFQNLLYLDPHLLEKHYTQYITIFRYAFFIVLR